MKFFSTRRQEILVAVTGSHQIRGAESRRWRRADEGGSLQTGVSGEASQTRRAGGNVELPPTPAGWRDW